MLGPRERRAVQGAVHQRGISRCQTSRECWGGKGEGEKLRKAREGAVLEAGCKKGARRNSVGAVVETEMATERKMTRLAH